MASNSRRFLPPREPRQTLHPDNVDPNTPIIDILKAMLYCSVPPLTFGSALRALWASSTVMSGISSSSLRGRSGFPSLLVPDSAAATPPPSATTSSATGAGGGDTSVSAIMTACGWRFEVDTGKRPMRRSSAPQPVRSRQERRVYQTDRVAR